MNKRFKDGIVWAIWFCISPFVIALCISVAILSAFAYVLAPKFAGALGWFAVTTAGWLVLDVWVRPLMSIKRYGRMYW